MRTQFHRGLVLILGGLALAATPGLAEAKANHGRHCGRGHAKHTRAIGHTCAGKHQSSNTLAPNGNPGNGNSNGPTNGNQGSNSSSAEKACRTEQASDPAAFKQKYGTNPNKANAFGKCVSQHANAGHPAQPENPADSGDTDSD